MRYLRHLESDRETGNGEREDASEYWRFMLCLDGHCGAVRMRLLVGGN